jgi:hypothetical protein
VSVWVPDIDESSFRAEAHRQSAAVAQSPCARDDQEFIEAIAERIAAEE